MLFVARETPRTAGSSAEVQQLLARGTDDDETNVSGHDSCEHGVDQTAKAAGADLEADAVRVAALLSPLGVLRLLVRRTAFWHITLGKALLLCVAIGSFAWMPTFYVRRGSLSINEVQFRHNDIAACLFMHCFCYAQTDDGNVD